MIAKRIESWIIYLIIIFLPLSAWMVSFFGDFQIALGRDVLVGIGVIFAISRIRSFEIKSGSSLFGLGFFLVVLVSYFYREADFTQWLRGVRFLSEPILLYLIVRNNLLTTNRDRALQIFFGITCVVVLISLIEIIYPGIIRISLHAGSRGYLDTIHKAQELLRLQSTLAGPNALGLFAMIALLLAPSWYRKVPASLLIAFVVLLLLIMLLTFSRSSYLGLFSGAIIMLFIFRNNVERFRKWLYLVPVLLLIIFGSLFLVKPQELTRYNSNTLRIDQYQRIWSQRVEIGFWGRGAGAAGLVSQYRLDNGPSRFTENTYLDIYESVGILGLLFYLTFWITLISELSKSKATLARSAIAGIAALLVAGLFINHFTGQAAIWILLVFAALANKTYETAESSGETFNP